MISLISYIKYEVTLSLTPLRLSLMALPMRCALGLGQRLGQTARAAARCYSCSTALPKLSWLDLRGAGLSAAERAFALIDADPNVVQTDSKDVPTLKGEIRFDDLHFRYTDKEPILTHFNLLIQPGETLALVGHTGAGKSSKIGRAHV